MNDDGDDEAGQSVDVVVVLQEGGHQDGDVEQQLGHDQSHQTLAGHGAQFVHDQVDHQAGGERHHRDGQREVEHPAAAVLHRQHARVEQVLAVAKATRANIEGGIAGIGHHHHHHRGGQG